MSHHAPKVDFGSKLMFIASAIALLLAVYVLLASLVNTYKKNSTKGEIDSTQLVAIASKNLMPIGVAATGDAVVAAPTSARSGKEVFNSVCTACHSTGAAGAPKVGDKAAWEPRIKQGLDALLNTAINGKGAMPARGGNPSVTDEELKAAIQYMAKQTGFDLGDAKPTAAQKEAAPATPKPAVAEKKADAPTTPATPAADKKPEVAAAQPANNAASLEEGKAVYDKTCFACHATGVAGSPKLGDKAAWEPRLAQGMDALYHTALNGKGAMPPKGGNVTLPDDKIKAAVDYMISKVK